MTGLLLLDPGLAVSVQDGGRPGLRRFGVPLSGALDPFGLAAANLLLGNRPDVAGLEIALKGPSLAACEQSVSVALAGAISGVIRRAAGGEVGLGSWQGARLEPGDRLDIAAPKVGIGYLAVSGGIGGELCLGSRSAYRRAGFGVLPVAGDILLCAPAGPLLSAAPWSHRVGPIRLLPGPQSDHFSPASLQALCAAPYDVAADSDRMGLRLSGERLIHNDKGADILTDAVIPGVIQVPANGQPILLLADAQSSGGYAKIAVVISADLPLLGHYRAGDRISFVWTDRSAARRALAELDHRFKMWRDNIGAIPGHIDAAALYHSNLVSGVISGEDS